MTTNSPIMMCSFEGENNVEPACPFRCYRTARYCTLCLRDWRGTSLLFRHLPRGFNSHGFSETADAATVHHTAHLIDHGRAVSRQAEAELIVFDSAILDWPDSPIAQIKASRKLAASGLHGDIGADGTEGAGHLEIPGAIGRGTGDGAGSAGHQRG